MELVAKTTESTRALLLPFSGVHGMPCSSCLEADTACRERADELDGRNIIGIPHSSKNGAYCDVDLLSLEHIKRSRHYQEFLAPHGIRWFAGIRVGFGDDVCCLSIQRTQKQRPFSELEKEGFARLSRTLSATAALAKAMGFAASGAILQALEVGGSAALLINRHGEVVQMTRSAERMLVGDPRVINRRLTSRDAAATTAFDQALRQLVWLRWGPVLAPAVVLPRRGRRPLLAYPVRISTLSANPFSDCRALVILIDLGLRKPLSEETLRSAFRLTEAESRVAARLGSGYGVDDVAEQLQLSTETIRTQIKNILGKTDTHRQAELVALIGALLVSADERTPGRRF
jgi:DNA-binding CsgD family transcriptional regulator